MEVRPKFSLEELDGMMHDAQKMSIDEFREKYQDKIELIPDDTLATIDLKVKKRSKKVALNLVGQS